MICVLGGDFFLFFLVQNADIVSDMVGTNMCLTC